MELTDEGTTLRTFITHHILIHIHQKKKIALEITAKIASVNMHAGIKNGI
jgi:hypothetical protein